MVLLVLVLLATAVLVVEYLHAKNEVSPSPDPKVPFRLGQDTLNMKGATHKWNKKTQLGSEHFEKAVTSEDYLLL